MFAGGRECSEAVPKCPQDTWALVPHCPDTSAPTRWCRNVMASKCLDILLKLELWFRVQRYADLEILGPHQSADSDQRPAYASAVVHNHRCAVSPRPQVTATPYTGDDSYHNQYDS